mmetsp:Transcript_14419/g.21835  ORF Transcript_14419/g.21835 Transcript_14419/m.21835 type:complete len:235 (+) Transcript_14419:55-759(+)
MPGDVHNNLMHAQVLVQDSLASLPSWHAVHGDELLQLGGLVASGVVGASAELPPGLALLLAGLLVGFDALHQLLLVAIHDDGGLDTSRRGAAGHAPVFWRRRDAVVVTELLEDGPLVPVGVSDAVQELVGIGSPVRVLLLPELLVVLHLSHIIFLGTRDQPSSCLLSPLAGLGHSSSGHPGSGGLRRGGGGGAGAHSLRRGLGWPGGATPGTVVAGSSAASSVGCAGEEVHEFH